tara:strand:+ start:810 stop:1202 length:393 start_codon:yes stop_codon:yes gene_type:complete
MKQTIRVLKVEQKTSAKGDTFYSVETDNGRATIWDKEIADKLVLNGDKLVVVEWSENKQGFKNIRKVYSDEYIGVTEEVVKSEPQNNNKFADARAEKNKSIYASYAKDLIISGIEEKEAVELVKRLIGAF